MAKSIDENIDAIDMRTHHTSAEFDWDDGKHASNLAKHGVDFIDVLAAFADPGRKIVRDGSRDYGEERYNMLARLDGRVFHITFTPRDPVTWIISARKANDREQKRYERQA
ncbi:BrnT family toxin [Rhizobium sp. SG2393]|uniref:BrnT family toxin n=1 Tax=Rhizobium sp. SG2393 TaxID=3276279 RepID=UPI00366D8B9C